MKDRGTKEGGRLAFDIDPEPLAESITGRAGLTLVAEAFRAFGASAAVERSVKLKQRERGLSEAEMVESFMLLFVAGGDCLDDFDVLRADDGLGRLLGRTFPSPEAARKFLYRFHDDDAMAKRPVDQLSWVPEETTPLVGLDRAVGAVVLEVGRRRPQERFGTVDMDATIIESRKREAYAHYEGGRGYQPEVAIWAETGLVLADEFRDGNVPAGQDPLSVVKRAFSTLPGTVTELAFRGDSACYNHQLLNWLRDEKRAGGPAGKIRFAISADMSQELRTRITALPLSEWKVLERPDGARASDADEERCWAEVELVPNGTTKKDALPDRYLAIRVRRRQGDFFEDGWRFFAVVTNEWDWPGSKVIHWHRAKAGTVEMVHDVIKNELAGGTMPCGRFGANAAWFRLNVLAYNLIVALKLLAMPAQYLDARPKRLRFAFFAVAARVTRSARTTLLRLVAGADAIRGWLATRCAIWEPLPD